MKLQLEQAEIEKAVQEYVANQGIKVEGKTLTVKFSMTRGEQGLIADLTIDEVKAEIKSVARAPRAGTVGAAIANQSVKQEAKPAPTTAKEAIEQATAAAEASKSNAGVGAGVSADEAGAGDTGSASAGDAESGSISQVGTDSALAGAAGKEEVVSTPAAAPAKSLFG